MTTYTAARIRSNLERLTSPPRAARSVANTFECRVKGCRRLVAINNSGWALCCCLFHHEALPYRIRVAIEACAEGSPFDPRAMRAAALVVSKTQSFFARAAGKRKAKR